MAEGEEISREELLRRIRALGTGLMPALEKGMKMATTNMERKAKENCTPGMTPYYRAPVQTGWLRENIESMVVTEPRMVVGSIYDFVEYAAYVHDGTYKMPARPFILDAIISERETTGDLIAEAVDEYLTEVAKE